MKRLLNCNYSDFKSMNSTQLKQSIAASEGRVIMCETIGTIPPMLGDVTNAELAASMSADMILLNIFDVNKPVINGMPKVPLNDTIKEIKRLTGRPVGINLEPVSDNEGPIDEVDDIWSLTGGRKGSVENARRAADMGADYIVLTGNPGVGVSNETITDAIKQIKDALGDRLLIIAGKMHSSGILSESAEKIVTKADVQAFVEAGADIMLLPAPATVPGITTEYVKGLVSYAHQLGALTLTAIGTSQEGADVDTIRDIALMCKMTGTDIHHLGDSGYTGIALPENILAYSKAIRGVRHTYHRMASSIRR